jgi:hypothetical protein
MRKCLLLIIIFLVPIVSKSQINLPLDWIQQYNNCADDIPNTIIRCSDNGFIIAGSNYSLFHPLCTIPPLSAFVAKTDSQGNLLWINHLTGMGASGDPFSVQSIIEVDSNCYVLTGCELVNSKSVWLAKLNSSGGIIWQYHYGDLNLLPSPYSRGTSLKRTYDGGFVVSGFVKGTSGDVTNSYGETDYWILKTDSMGIIQWEKSFGGSDFDIAFDIIQCADSGYAITGSSSSSDFIVSNNFGFRDIWLIRIDKSGNLIWEKNFGGSFEDIPNKLIACKDGDLLIAGQTESWDHDISILNGLQDGWFIKINMSGNIVWEKTIGSSIWPLMSISDIVEADTGHFYFTGTCLHNLLPIYNMIIGEINYNGIVSWSEKYPLASYLHNPSLIINDGIYITGRNDPSLFLMKLMLDYNVIAGRTYIDLNSNASLDINEPFVKNNQITESNSGRVTFSESDGNYFVNLPDTGNYTVQPSPLSYFNPVPVSRSVYFPAFNTTNTGNDFAFQPNGVYNDLKIVLTPMTAFRRGFNATFDLYYKNVGTTTISNPVVQLFMDTILSYQNSSLLPSSVTADSITWNLPSLGVFDDGHIQVNVMVDLNAVLGSVVNATATIEPLVNDNVPGDNFSSVEGQIIGSFDPNDIAVNYDTVYLSDPATHELEYLIRFQNTGNDTAFTVEISTPISPLLDFNEFELSATSHPASMSFSPVDRHLRVRFDNILLPDSGTNQTGSNGYIRFKIRPVNTINAGDIIEAKADIYFDFNTAVETNTATSIVLLSTGISENIREKRLMIFPNPVTHSANVDIVLTEKSRIDMFIYNSTGQLVSRNSQPETPAGKHRLEFSTAELEKGIYMLRIITGNNAYTAKFVK